MVHLCPGRAAKPALIALCLLTIIATHSLITSTDSASAAQVTVAWDPATDPGLAGYKIYWGTVSKNYSWSADAAAQPTYTVPSLSEGATYYFAATAYDGSHTESGFSNEATYTVPSACTYAISLNSQSIGAGGGTVTVAVSAATACSWATSNNASWISVTSGASGKGNGTVTCSVAANTGTGSRAAGLTIAGQILTITQAGVQTSTIAASAGPNGTISPSGQVGVTNSANQTFAIAPITGYKVADVLVDGSSVGAVSSYTFTNVTANHTISASFAAMAYALSVSTSGTGSGTVTSNPSGTTFGAGTSVTLTATPGANATFAGWSGGCSGTSTTCTVTMNSNLSVTAAFLAGQAQYTISATAGSGGSISPSGSASVNAGANQSFTITPGSGYAISSVTVDGASAGTVGSYTFNNVTANHTIQASFAPSTPASSGYTLTVAYSGSGSGMVTSSGWQTTYKPGTILTLTARPYTGSMFGGWSGGCSGTSTTCTVTMNSNLSVTAAFLSGQGYTISATAGSGGSISPSGSASVNAGANQSFTITPGSGYAISSVTVDGASAGTVSSYTFTNVTANHTIQASFAPSTPASSYTLTVTYSGSGSGMVTSNPSGTTFSAGKSVTLTATPGANATFAGWSGGCSGTSTTCTVTMNSNLSVTAAFLSSQAHYTISATAGSGGSISPSGSASVNAGANQSFTITAGSGYAISSVTVDGASAGTVSSYAFTNVTANHTIQASFAPSTPAANYTLAVTYRGSGSGMVTSGGWQTIYKPGTIVTLTARPYTGSTFGGWSGGCSGTSTTCTVVVNANITVTATFNSTKSYSSAGH